jgi:hypothetical protein
MVATITMVIGTCLISGLPITSGASSLLPQPELGNRTCSSASQVLD